MMQKLLTVTLDAKQVRQACETFVADMMGDPAGERNDYRAAVRAVRADTQADCIGEVTISKKRARKSRAAG